MNIFRFCPGIKLSFEHNSARRNQFLNACFCWNSKQSLREIEQKFTFGGTICYGDLYLDFLLRHLKVFRLHAEQHDAAGAVRADSGKRTG